MRNKYTIQLTKKQAAQIAKEYNKEYNEEQGKANITFSIAKAARMIGIGERTIHRYIKEGLITAKQIGKRDRISQEEIDRFRKTLE